MDQRIVTSTVEFDALDRALAKMLGERDASPGATLVAATAALLSAQRSNGHACINLSEWQGCDLPGDGWRGERIRLPAADEWRRVLSCSSMVGDGASPTPIVVQEDRCYLYRYWKAERRVAERLLARAEERITPAVNDELRRTFRALFPKVETVGVDLQALAATVALNGNLAVVSGGPGTGKTTVASRTLLLLLACEPASRIALAAPTGKAAARLTESIERELTSVGAFPEPSARVPRAMTVHRLLGMRPRAGGFRYDASRPLPADVVVVDEASMLDLLLVDALLDALLPTAKLILLGDRDQLASVETGVVFGDLCAVAASLQAPGEGEDAAGARPISVSRGEETASLYGELCGVALPSLGEVLTLADRFVELIESHRFAAGSGIAMLAARIRRGDADGVMALLDDAAVAEVSRADPHAAVSQLDDWLDEWLRSCLEADHPAEALRRLNELRLLCALRRGPWGVETLNRLIERRLDPNSAGSNYYRGKPLLVTANDYRQRLFNGDIGMTWSEAGRLTVCFASEDDGLRSVAPALLPPHETAWAMTVHKSQGSEFGRVLLVLPPEDNPVLTRELLYTGVTRARSEVRVVADEATVRRTVERAHSRASGLAQQLARGGPLT